MWSHENCTAIGWRYFLSLDFDINVAILFVTAFGVLMFERQMPLNGLLQFKKDIALCNIFGWMALCVMPLGDILRR